MSRDFATRAEAGARGMTIAWVAQERPDHLAIASPSGNRTYGDLNRRANKIARWLYDIGVNEGDTIAVALTNRAEFADLYTASARCGLRFVPANYHLKTDELAYIIENCEAKVFAADHTLAAVAAEARKLSPNLLAAVSVGGAIDGYDDLEASIAQYDDSNIERSARGMVMFYTSGTTGRPKGVLRRRVVEALQAHPRPPANPATAPLGEVPRTEAPAAREGDPERTARRNAGERGNSVILCTGPLYHSAPMSGNLMTPLHGGETVVLMQRFDAEEALRLIDRYKVTQTHMVATMFHRLLALPDEVKRKYDLSSLVRVSHGAAPTPVHVKKAMMDWFGPVIYEYYASTEAGGCTITPEEWLKKPGSVGKPSAGQVMKILDDDGKELGVGEVGTIYFDANVNGGFDYYKDPEKTQSVYLGSMFTLGDQGYFDEDGYLFLTGRSSELIISGGVNIYPAEIDAVLLMHPAVRDAAAVGVPNEEFGEEVKAVVELKDGFTDSPELAEQLIAFCRERLAHFKCPRSIDFIAELPRSAAGKVYRKKVREPYWEGHATT